MRRGDRGEEDAPRFGPLLLRGQRWNWARPPPSLRTRRLREPLHLLLAAAAATTTAASSTAARWGGCRACAAAAAAAARVAAAALLHLPVRRRAHRRRTARQRGGRANEVQREGRALANANLPQREAIALRLKHHVGVPHRITQIEENNDLIALPDVARTRQLLLQDVERGVKRDSEVQIATRMVELDRYTAPTSRHLSERHGGWRCGE